jgi:hypothetical protein
MSLKEDSLGAIYNRAPRYLVRNYRGDIFSVPNNYVEHSNGTLGDGTWYKQDNWTLVAGRGWKSNNSLFTSFMFERDRDRFEITNTGVPTDADGRNYFWTKDKTDKDDHIKIKTDSIPGYERLSLDNGSISNPYLIAERGSSQYDIGFPLFKIKSENDFIKEHLKYLRDKYGVSCVNGNQRNSDVCILACDKSLDQMKNIDPGFIDDCKRGKIQNCLDNDNYKNSNNLTFCKDAISDGGQTFSNVLANYIGDYCAKTAGIEKGINAPAICKTWWTAYDDGSTVDDQTPEGKFMSDIMKTKYYYEYCKDQMGSDQFCMNALNSSDDIVQNNIQKAASEYYQKTCVGDNIKNNKICTDAASSSNDNIRNQILAMRDTWCTADSSRQNETICYPRLDNTICTSTGDILKTSTMNIVPLYRSRENSYKGTNGATFLYYDGKQTIADTDKAFKSNPIFLNYFNNITFTSTSGVKPPIGANSAIKDNYWAIRIMAYLQIPTALGAGGYKFQMLADNSATLYLNNISLLTSNNTNETMNYSINLDPSRVYFLRVDFKEYTGSASLTIKYQKDGTTTWTDVPTTWFKPYMPLKSVRDTYLKASTDYCKAPISSTNTTPRYQSVDICKNFISKESSLNNDIIGFCNTGNNWLDNTWCEDLTKSRNLNPSLLKSVIENNINKMASLAITSSGKSNPKVISYFKDKYLLDLNTLGITGSDMIDRINKDILNNANISYVEISDPDKTTEFSKMLYTTYASYLPIKSSEIRLKEINCLTDNRFVSRLERHVLSTPITVGTTVVLPSSGNTTANFYNNWWIKILSATQGKDQIRKVTAYNSTTRALTLDKTLSPIPTGTVTIGLYPIDPAYEYCKAYSEDNVNFVRFIAPSNAYCATGDNIATDYCQNYYNTIESKIVTNYGCSDSQLGIKDTFINKETFQNNSTDDDNIALYVLLFIIVLIGMFFGARWFSKRNERSKLNFKVSPIVLQKK